MNGGRWFRLYVGVVHDPKVQSLPPRLFKFWINLLCITAENDGVIPPLSVVVTSLKSRTDVVEAFLNDLKNRGLIDQIEGRLEPHNWRIRQYKTETSAERTKRWRKRQSDVTVTAPDTDTDTDRVKKLNNNIIKASNSCAHSPFSIKPGMPEWDAWERYSKEHKKQPALDLAMDRVREGQQKTITVAARLPEEIDKGYAAALELKKKLDEKAS